MKNLIAWFVRNPVAANLMMVLMFAAGVFGYFSLEREFIPQTTVNGVSINVSWPGQAHATFNSNSSQELKKPSTDLMVLTLSRVTQEKEAGLLPSTQNLILIMRNLSMK
jgi:Cu/Ag efflux pump CusA